MSRKESDIEHFIGLEAALNFLLSFRICKTRNEAIKYLRDRIPAEGVYQTEIKKFLESSCHGAFIWKAAAGPYSRGGIPDINMVYNGKFYGFEVKRPYFGKISQLQKETIEKINKAGGRAAVVTFPSEVAEIIMTSDAEWKGFIENHYKLLERELEYIPEGE